MRLEKATSLSTGAHFCVRGMKSLHICIVIYMYALKIERWLATNCPDS